MAVQAAKRAIAGDLGDGLDHEHALFMQAFGSEDVREGVQAFNEKRKPAWQHR